MKKIQILTTGGQVTVDTGAHDVPVKLRNLDTGEAPFSRKDRDGAMRQRTVLVHVRRGAPEVVYSPDDIAVQVGAQ